METAVQTREESKLILPSGTEKLMARVRVLEAQALSARSAEISGEYKGQYKFALSRLARRWLSLKEIGQLSEEEYSALDFIVYKKSVRQLTIWGLANTVILIAGTCPVLLIPGFGTSVLIFIVLVLLAMANGLYFDPDPKNPMSFGNSIFKFLRARRFLKEQGCLGLEIKNDANSRS